MIITGTLTTALLEAIMLTNFALPLPNFYIGEEYPEEYSYQTTDAFYSSDGTAYLKPTATKWAILDEICEHSFGFDDNFPNLDIFVSDYCSDNKEECPSEWCQRYVVDGFRFKQEAGLDEEKQEIYDYLYDSIGREYETYSIYGYSVSWNYLYINLNDYK